MLYAFTPTASRLNYRLDTYKENLGEGSYRLENLQNDINRIVPSDYLKDGHIIKPETFLKKHPEKAQEVADLLNATPSTKEIYDDRQQTIEKYGGEPETFQQWKENTRENNRIREAVDANLSGLYKYKGGKKIPRNKSSAQMIDYLKQSHKSKELMSYIADNIETLNKGRRIPRFKGVLEKGF